jgi:hypothetical protein
MKIHRIKLEEVMDYKKSNESETNVHGSKSDEN